MSITSGFEKKEIIDPSGGSYYNAIFVQDLLAHARALEDMLRKHQWSGDGPWCQECGNHQDDGHASDCSLAKLIGE